MSAIGPYLPVKQPAIPMSALPWPPDYPQVGHPQPVVGAGAELDFEQLRRRDHLHRADGTGAASSEFERGQNTLRNVSVQGAAMALARA